MKKHFGSSFDSFLRGEGIKGAVDLRAKKKIIADELRTTLRPARGPRAAMAKRAGQTIPNGK